MLDGTGEEPGGFEGDGLVFLVGGTDTDAGGAGDLGRDAREAQAAFDAGVGFAEEFDFGVDEDHGHVVVGRNFLAVHPHLAGAIGDVADVEDAELNGASDLLGGEADAIGFVHGFDHVGSQSEDFLINGGDAAAFCAEAGVAVLDDFEEHD